MSPDALTGSSVRFDFLNALSGEKGGNEKIKTCIQCGSCTGSCVAAEGMTLSPRKLWRSVQMGMEPEVMESMSFWNCTTCALCDKRCPRGIPLSQIMLSLRTRYGREGGNITGVSQTLDNLRKSGNIMGEEPGSRFLWIDNLGFTEDERKGLFREESELVYFTGCVGALFPQVGGIPQSLVKLLGFLKADFSLLANEWCCGYPVMAGGKDFESLREYAERNVAAIEKKGAKTVIVSCPTCYYMFTKVYPEFFKVPFSFSVKHYAEYLEGLYAELCFDAANPAGGTANDTVVTYHDPCDLGRKLHITGAPRNILKHLGGVTLAEMRFSGEEGKCCGGGGNLEMVNPELSLGIAARRIGDALETGAEYLLSSCQQCKRTLQNAARKSRARIKVMDLLEFLLLRANESGKAGSAAGAAK
ncbi:MAG: (Fe-S)-binding protein [Treponema sp.]|nr:(Fe-S)-binding protein [Treponema sp.]